MKYIFTLVLSSFCFLSYAQKPEDNEKARNIYYYKKGFIEVSTKDSADIIQIITEPDAGEKLYDVQEFYKNGTIYFAGKSSEVHPIKLNGQGVFYYPNSNKEFVANYVSGWRSGETYHYYNNGKMHLVMDYSIKDSLNREQHRKVSYKDSLYKFEYDTIGKPLVEDGQGHFVNYNERLNKITEEGDVKNSRRAGEWKGYDPDYNLYFNENYENGRLRNGTATDSLGRKYVYYNRFKPADYPRDSKGRFVGYMLNNIHYPADARERNIQGTVTIGFKISDKGETFDYKILHSVSPSLDAEAMRVVKGTIGWKPAEVYGRKINSDFVAPVSFTLQGQ